jgi:hypothetical protein
LKNSKIGFWTIDPLVDKEHFLETFTKVIDEWLKKTDGQGGKKSTKGQEVDRATTQRSHGRDPICFTRWLRYNEGVCAAGSYHINHIANFY